MKENHKIPLGFSIVVLFWSHTGLSQGNPSPATVDTVCSRYTQPNTQGSASDIEKTTHIVGKCHAREGIGHGERFAYSMSALYLLTSIPCGAACFVPASLPWSKPACLGASLGVAAADMAGGAIVGQLASQAAEEVSKGNQAQGVISDISSGVSGLMGLGQTIASTMGGNAAQRIASCATFAVSIVQTGLRFANGRIYTDTGARVEKDIRDLYAGNNSPPTEAARGPQMETQHLSSGSPPAGSSISQVDQQMASAGSIAVRETMQGVTDRDLVSRAVARSDRPSTLSSEQIQKAQGDFNKAMDAVEKNMGLSPQNLASALLESGKSPDAILGSLFPQAQEGIDMAMKQKEQVSLAMGTNPVSADDLFRAAHRGQSPKKDSDLTDFNALLAGLLPQNGSAAAGTKPNGVASLSLNGQGRQPAQSLSSSKDIWHADSAASLFEIVSRRWNRIDQDWNREFSSAPSAR